MRDWTKDGYTLVYVLRRHWKGVVLAMIVLLLFFTTQSWAYVISQKDGYDVVWDEPTVEMSIRAGDGCPEVIWPCVHTIRRAMETWNQAGPFRFEDLGYGFDVCDHHDGVSTIGWSRDLCGEKSQLSGHRAARTITRFRYESGAPVVAERDVVMDPSFLWDGLNFYMTALHELGHVIGLAHPNEHGQHVYAIMNNPFYATTIQQDDIDGVIAAYSKDEEEEVEKEDIRGVLENPSDLGVVSGIGVISGWVCDADVVEIAILREDGRPLSLFPSRMPVPHKSERRDTENVCGDADNGFTLLMNWQLLPPDLYLIQVFADGVMFDAQVFTAGGLGEEFFRGRDGQRYTVPDFPRQGQNTIIMWQESQQNFVVVESGPSQ